MNTKTANLIRIVKFTSRTKYGKRRAEAYVSFNENDRTAPATTLEIETSRHHARVAAYVHNCTLEEWNALDVPVEAGTNWKQVNVGNTTLVVFAPTATATEEAAA